MTDEEKATVLYKEICDYLDHLQAIVYETISAGHALDQGRDYHISLAQGIIKDYDALPEDTKNKFTELSEKVMSGELSVEEALGQTPYFHSQKDMEPVNVQMSSNGKKPLLN